MDPKTQVMISLGAAIGANCIPCFDHIYSKARELQLDEAEIKETIDIGFKVKNGAAIFLKNAIGDVVGDVSAQREQPCCVNSTETCC